jgi:hypothetical protein
MDRGLMLFPVLHPAQTSARSQSIEGDIARDPAPDFHYAFISGPIVGGPTGSSNNFRAFIERVNDGFHSGQ